MLETINGLCPGLCYQYEDSFSPKHAVRINHCDQGGDLFSEVEEGGAHVKSKLERESFAVRGPALDRKRVRRTGSQGAEFKQPEVTQRPF